MSPTTLNGAATMSLDECLAALRGLGLTPKRSGGGYACRCPAHDDAHPSLSIGRGDDGKLLLHCHAGCSFDQLLAALGAGQGGHKATRAAGRNLTPAGDPVNGGFVICQRLRDRVFDSEAEALASCRLGEPTSVWRYTNAQGEAAGAVARWETGGGKTYRPLRLQGGKWSLGAMAEPRPLYALAELQDADESEPVYVVEGEKSADAGRCLGLTTTTSAGGSKGAGKTDWSPLRGRSVCVIPDHDEPGRAYADNVRKLALEAGAVSVRVIDPAEHFRDLPKGGDLADLAGGEDADTLRETIEALAKEPPEAGAPTPPMHIYKPFPTHTLPGPIRGLCEAGAESMRLDAAFVALPLLAACAAAVGNATRIRLNDSWTEPAILWTAIVAESGSGKTPAMSLATQATKRIQTQRMREHQDAIESWKKEHDLWAIQRKAWERSAASKAGTHDAAPEEPPQPVSRRVMIDSVTTEAAIKLHAENPRGLLAASDELAGFFDFGAYKTSRGSGDSSKWLQAWNGGALTNDRVGDRKAGGIAEHIPMFSISLTGGIQPGALRRVFTDEHRESGMAPRFLLAMPTRTPRRFDNRGVGQAVQAAVARVVGGLYALPDPQPDAFGELRPQEASLTKEAEAAFGEYHDTKADEANASTGIRAAIASKMAGYAARLALVFHCVRVADGEADIDPRRVDETTMRSAIELAEWFLQESDRVYAVLDAGEEEGRRLRLIEWVAAQGGPVSGRDAHRALPDYENTEDATAALRELADLGYGCVSYPAPGKAGGRPAAMRFSLR